MREIKDFFPDYHDGEFLAPRSGAKLASLFDMDQTESHGNESFRFTAPKQPKKSASTLGLPHLKPAPAILLAVAVHAFRFVNGQYVSQGKLGAAILGNHVTKEYKVLLYGSQQKQITTAQIHHGFILTLQSGNYTAFYDDQQQSWSLKFESENDRIGFYKQVCIARWNSQTCLDTPVTQDLVHGEGPAIVMGDTVKIAFSGWLLQNHAIGQLFDSTVGKDKLQKVRLGSFKTLRGWEKEMLGMQKGGRRLIIIPPGMNGGSKAVPNNVPLTSTLVFDVEIQQVKRPKYEESLCWGSSDSFSPSLIHDIDDKVIECVPQSAISVSSDPGDQASQDKHRAINELPKNPDPTKAKLICRMSKMGRPALPLLEGAVAAHPSNSETGEVRESGPAAPSSLSAQSVSPKTATVQHPMASHVPHEAYSTSQIQTFTSNFPAQHAPYLTPDLSSLLITEARQQNTEIRLAVARVNDKVDYLISKVDELYRQGVCSNGLSGVSLESAMILQNIKGILQENVALKKEVLERDSKVEEQSQKIGELIEQRYTEHCMVLEPRHEVLQNSIQYNHARQLQAEKEKACLAEELCAASSSVCELQQEAGRLQQRVTDLQAKLNAALQEVQRRCTQISHLDAQMEELGREVEHIQQHWRAEKQKSRKLELTVKHMDEEIQDLRTDNESLEQMLSDRKRKWQQERERFLKEQKELLSTTEQDQLRRARVHHETHIRQQLELEWQERCAVALEEQRLNLQGMIIELQKRELERDRKQPDEQVDVQVKWVMNGLFHYLRTEFDLQESYTGESVLQIVLNSIKYVTMRFLKQLESEVDDDEEEEYVTTEETEECKEEERTGKSEEEDHSQVSLDQTYVTADEAGLSEASSGTD